MTGSEQDTPPSQHQPMSAEDHAKLQEMLTEFYDAIGHKNRALAVGIAYDIVGQQVIESLLAENAALREIVQATAAMPDDPGNGFFHVEECPFCGAFVPGDAPIQHTPPCPVTKARALVQSS